MSTADAKTRIDEVSTHYRAACIADTIGGWLYWICAATSLLLLFPSYFSPTALSVLQIAFIAFTILLFFLFLVSKLWLIPFAEGIRRKQLLTDAYGVLLTSEMTQAYYNNGFPPSHKRLAANVMENSFFGRETSSAMLPKVRTQTFGYLAIWFVVLAYRKTPMETVMWISQAVFSVDIIAYWLSLEVLKARHAVVYQKLYDLFLNNGNAKDAKLAPAILDAFATYESTKANAGVLLDSKVFFRVNDRVSQEWNRVKECVGIPLGDQIASSDKQAPNSTMQP
jgi:hypothetical protein